MIDKRIVQKIVMAGVVMHGEQVLILQRHDDETTLPGMWELPSGKRDALENSTVALLREVREETGLDVEVVAPVSFFDYQIEKPEEIRDSTQINVLVRVIGEPLVHLSKEHQSYEWIGENQIDKYELSPATKESVRLAFTYVSG